MISCKIVSLKSILLKHKYIISLNLPDGLLVLFDVMDHHFALNVKLVVIIYLFCIYIREHLHDS